MSSIKCDEATQKEPARLDGWLLAGWLTGWLDGSPASVMSGSCTARNCGDPLTRCHSVSPKVLPVGDGKSCARGKAMPE